MKIFDSDRASGRVSSQPGLRVIYCEHTERLQCPGTRYLLDRLNKCCSRTVVIQNATSTALILGAVRVTVDTAAFSPSQDKFLYRGGGDGRQFDRLVLCFFSMTKRSKR